MPYIPIKKSRASIVRDPIRVITQYYNPGDIERTKKTLNRILSLSTIETDNLFKSVYDGFSDRHEDLDNLLMMNYQRVQSFVQDDQNLTDTQKLLIGALFTREYSIESAALFNPSIIPHPDQSNLLVGSKRFILSLRATGEGHISSIVFRSGMIDKNGKTIFDPISEYVETPYYELNPLYDKALFRKKIQEMNITNKISIEVFDTLSDSFHFNELNSRIEELRKTRTISLTEDETIEIIYWIALSNYEVNFSPDTYISERVIFPISKYERNGIEDARFVQFLDDNGEITYYATYTAFSGYAILPMLLETKDFIKFKMRTLNGKAVKGKGMALFPRRIHGQYIMISRQDGENLYIMKSQNIDFWDEMEILRSPKYTWEIVQIGNCGSPIETKEGWILLTHGVGLMRTYSIGAILLDLDDPSKILGVLDKPLITPSESEREGYVPNVVYSCGPMIHNDLLIIPYASSDTFTGIATVKLAHLLKALKQSL